MLFVVFSKKQSDPTWFQEQIQEDLAQYSKEELAPKKIESFFSNSRPSYLLVHYQIKDHKLYIKTNWDSNESYDRVIKTSSFLERIVRKNKIPDCSFVLTVHDGLQKEDFIFKGSKMPAFCYAKDKEATGILFPDPLTVNFAEKGRKSFKKHQLKRKYHWANKKEVAFWRGGTTGPAALKRKSYGETFWYSQPRTQLALLSKYHPEQIDTGFTTFPGVEASIQEKMLTHLSKANWTQHKDHMLYKYLVIPDGNTCTYPRYYLALCSGSVAFKQNSDQIQWFYKGLTAQKHFVAIEHDFSDLPEKVLWAQKNDALMKSIAKASKKWIAQNLTPKLIEQYAKVLLMEYAEKQNSSSALLEGSKSVQELKKERKNG